MRRAGETLSRVQLLDAAWDIAFESHSNVVDVYVRYLREKIYRPFVTCTDRDRSRGRLPPQRRGAGPEPPADPDPADTALRTRDGRGCLPRSAGSSTSASARHSSARLDQNLLAQATEATLRIDNGAGPLLDRDCDQRRELRPAAQRPSGAVKTSEPGPLPVLLDTAAVVPGARRPFGSPDGPLRIRGRNGALAPAGDPGDDEWQTRGVLVLGSSLCGSGTSHSSACATALLLLAARPPAGDARRLPACGRGAPSRRGDAPQGGRDLGRDARKPPAGAAGQRRGLGASR